MIAGISAEFEACEGAPTGRRLRRAVHVRWVGLALLLLAELIVLETRFDTASLVDEHQWWAELIGRIYLVPHVGIAIVAAALVFAGPSLQTVLRESAERLYWAHKRWLAFLFCHFAALGGFAVLTAHLLEGDMRKSPTSGAWFVGWIVAGLGVVVFWAAAALPTGLWSPVLRRTFRPILVSGAIGVAAWWAGDFTGRLWHPLARCTFWIFQAVLGLFLPDFFCDADRLVVGTNQFACQIAPACSGYEGIGLISVFLLVYLWVSRGKLRFPHALVLLPLGIVVIWLCNVVRIGLLVLIGSRLSPAVALGGFHSQAGWLAFNAVALGLVAIAGRWRFLSAVDAVPAAAGWANPAAAYLAPFLAIVAAAMVTGAFSDATQPDWFYPLRVLVAVATLWCFRKVYLQWQWAWSWQAVAIGAGAFAVWVALLWAPGGAAPDAAGWRPVAGVPIGMAATWWCFRVVGYVVVVPLAEELAFRGYLTRRLISADFEKIPSGRFSWLSFLVSSALFGAMHGGHWLVGTLAGMLFAWAWYRRGRLADAVLAHATTNGLLAVYAATTGHWHLWS